MGVVEETSARQIRERRPGERPALPVDKEEGGPRPCSSSVLAACPLSSEYLSEERGGTRGEAVTVSAASG